MKSALIVALVIFSQISFAKDFLKADQKNIILKEIDSICADTWCAGDYNYNFLSLKCDDTKATCQLNYELISWESEDAKLSLNCKIKPLKKFSDMATKTKQFHYLTDEFYKMLTDCFEINEIKYGTQLLY